MFIINFIVILMMTLSSLKAAVKTSSVPQEDSEAYTQNSFGVQQIFAECQRVIQEGARAFYLGMPPLSASFLIKDFGPLPSPSSLWSDTVTLLKPPRSLYPDTTMPLSSPSVMRKVDLTDPGTSPKTSATKYVEVTSPLVSMQNWWTQWPEPHNSLFGIASAVYGLDRDTLIARRQSVFEGSLNLVSQNLLTGFKESEQRSIPLVTHRIWLTGRGELAHEAPQQSLEYYVKSVKMLPDWEGGHHFWCTNLNDIPHTIDFLRSAALPITIHSIEELKFIKEPGEERKGVKKLFDAYLENKLYCLASDILRHVILNEKGGGFYSDIGVEVTEPDALRSYAGSCKSILFCHPNGYVDTCLFGLTPTNPATEKYLTTLNDLMLNKLPHVASLTRNADGTQNIQRQMNWTAFPHFYAAFYSTYGKGETTLVIPDNTFIKVHHNNSWHIWSRGVTKFGNVSREQSGLDIFKICLIEAQHKGERTQ